MFTQPFNSIVIEDLMSQLNYRDAFCPRNYTSFWFAPIFSQELYFFLSLNGYYLFSPRNYTSQKMIGDWKIVVSCSFMQTQCINMASTLKWNALAKMMYVISNLGFPRLVKNHQTVLKLADILIRKWQMFNSLCTSRWRSKKSN